jgi:hypothetical protein
MKLSKRMHGDVVRIAFGDGQYTYARVLEEASYAIYDLRTTEDVPIDQVVARPVLFYVAVMDQALKRGRWAVIGNLPLSGELLNPPPRFIQDPLRYDTFSIYQNGKIRTATEEECLRLERAAVWDSQHVEDRIRDHYEGKPNKWLDCLIRSGSNSRWSPG